ncbi:hypothetical protein FOA52_007204 [Chlamydomonas sp. UWO 241]|nr:hypothetical protein FOA52_007204 [Chlamydomonas sp. UWO 241]
MQEEAVGLEEMGRALREAADEGDVAAMRSMLLDPCTDPAALLMSTDNWGTTALMLASVGGHVEAMRVVLDHLSSNAAAMMMLANSRGGTALIGAATGGHVDAMRLLLDHPSANPAAMMHSSKYGYSALGTAALGGHVHAMRLLLDHPSADPAVMMAVGSNRGRSALVAAAQFAADGDDCCPGHRCVPLLLLLRLVAADPQPSDAQRAHMNEVMKALCMVDEEEEGESDDDDEDEKEEKKLALFDDDQPDDARDESIRLLLEHGAFAVPYNSPVMSRIIREVCAMARVPQRLNEAALGVAIARQEDKPRGV